MTREQLEEKIIDLIETYECPDEAIEFISLIVTEYFDEVQVDDLSINNAEQLLEQIKAVIGVEDSNLRSQMTLNL